MRITAKPHAGLWRHIGSGSGFRAYEELGADNILGSHQWGMPCQLTSSEHLEKGTVLHPYVCIYYLYLLPLFRLKHPFQVQVAAGEKRGSVNCGLKHQEPPHLHPRTCSFKIRILLVSGSWNPGDTHIDIC